MIGYLPLVDVLALVVVGLLVPQWWRHRLARVAALVVLVACGLSLVLLFTAPWGKGGCFASVWELMTSQFDYSEGGAPPGCRDPESQASWALRLTLVSVSVAMLVGAGYGLKAVSADR